MPATATGAQSSSDPDTTVAERVIYLPSLGVCMGFALILTSGLRTPKDQFRTPAWVNV